MEHIKNKKLKLFEDVLGEYLHQGKEYLFFCPFCDHHKPKLSVCFDKGAKCWVCHKRFRDPGVIFKFLKKTETWNEWRLLTNSFTVVEELDTLLNPALKEVSKKQLNFPKEFINLYENYDNKLHSEPIEYLSSRNINKQQILDWRIGYCHSGWYEKRIIVPSFDIYGNINYFVGRDYSNLSNYNYMAPSLPKDIIFNDLFVDWNKDVILVEGVFDMFVAENSIPLLGNLFNIERCSLLMSKLQIMNKRIYICLDEDASSEANRLIDKLLRHGLNLFKIDLSDSEFGDAGSMTKEQFSNFKQNAKQMNNEKILYELFKNI